MRQGKQRGTARQLHTRTIGHASAALLLALLAGCASTPDTTPVLYPNAHLQQVGRAAADQDIRECQQLAREHGVSETRDGQVGQKAAGGAAIAVLVCSCSWRAA